MDESKSPSAINNPRVGNKRMTEKAFLVVEYGTERVPVLRGG
jgi:hypothetical protein